MTIEKPASSQSPKTVHNSEGVDTTIETPKVLLLDGHSLAFRAFYALPAESFSTADGQHTNAVYGFLSMLTNLVKDERPDYILAAFDEGKETFRHKEYPDYKAQRKPTPEEFKGQVELIRELLDSLAIPSVSLKQFEADDILATLATEAARRGMHAYICTGDKDSFQLISDSITVLYPHRGVSVLKRYTPSAVHDRFDVTPTQYPGLAALRGDASDNLPGVPRVGVKTAAKWLNKYGDLENLLDHTDEIKGVVGENLRGHIEDVKRNYHLTKMVLDVPLDLDIEEGAVEEADASKLNALFDNLEFGKRLRERVLTTFNQLENVEDEQETAELNITIAQDGNVADWLETHRNEEGIWGLTITGNSSAVEGDVDRIAIASPQHSQLVISVVELTPDDEQALASWLSDSDIAKSVHDAKAAAHCLAGRRWKLAGVECDTMVASYLVRPGQRNMDFGEVLARHTGMQLDTSQDNGQMSLIDLDNADSVAAAENQAHAAAAQLILTEQLRSDIADIDETKLFETMEMPLVSVLQRMEADGIAVSLTALHELEREFSSQAGMLEKEAFDAIDDDSVNLNSPKQLQAVLFDQLKMPKTKKTKTGYSTNAESLEMLYEKTGHPFLAALLGYRAVTKLKTTVTGLINSVTADERIHTTFNQTITTTGRLSSTDPNLQNIPVRTPEGKRIRDVFIAGSGYECLLTADYSQIEMRVMAHLSEDEGLIDAFRKGEDLHSYVGSVAFDVPIDQVTPELRRRTKALSYGLAYGLSPYGLARQLDIPVAEAKSFMDNYFERFGGVRDYLKKVVDQARKDGYTETMFGRRRYLPDLTSSHRVARENAERAALNAPIQGTAADIIKIAMLKVDAELSSAGLKSRVLLQVHDELVVEVAGGELEQVKELVTRNMDQAVKLSVPLEVSVGWGSTWNAAAH